MLDSLVRPSWVRYVTLTTTLLTSNLTYAQTPPAAEGAYYIDPAKRRERQERKEREEREAREAAAAATPTPAPLPSSTPPILPVECNTAEECFQRGTKVYQERDFDRAAEFFKRSYNLAPRQRSRSILLYNTAIAYEKAGDAVKSVHYYELYLHEMPDAKEQEEIGRKMPGLRLFAEADRLQEAGKHREAVKLYREASALLSDKDTLAAITADVERSEQQLNERSAESSLVTSSLIPSSRKPTATPPYLQPADSAVTPPYLRPTASEPVPRYLQPDPRNHPTKNKDNDTLGYLLMAAGGGLAALFLISYALADECPDGIQEGGVVKDCHKHITERGWTALGLSTLSFGAGLYLVLD